ncbi:MAG TPA: hypothetical protein VFW80_07705 [Gaiellaceae bacterium]|nr:hypothetical protein [Gaiellaceae bacterium]
MGEQVPPLSVGLVVGGLTPANHLWEEAVKRLGKQIAKRRAGLKTPLNVNVVFHIPGDVLTLDYDGERTGSFSKRDGTLMVQVAIPDEPPKDVDAEVRRRLLAAMDEAERWATKSGIADNLNSLKDFACSL